MALSIPQSVKPSESIRVAQRQGFTKCRKVHSDCPSGIYVGRILETFEIYVCVVCFVFSLLLFFFFFFFFLLGGGGVFPETIVFVNIAEPAEPARAVSSFRNL